MIKLSIITINYNDAAGLRKTLASVALQTYPHIEHIIVDGASTDGSVEIIRQYADNQAKGESLEAKGTGNEVKGERLEVKGEENGEADTPASTLYTLHSTPTEISTPIYTNLHNSTPSTHTVRWISEKDKGIYNAMNKGIRMATGDYIQILNSGDILAAPDVTERMMAALEAQQVKGERLEAKGLEDEIKGERLEAKGTENGEADTQAFTPYTLHSTPTDASTPYTLHSTPTEASSPYQNLPAILYGNMIKEYPDGRRVKDTCGGGDYTPESFLYFYRGTLNHDCAYIRRDLFEKYGLYNEQMKICSDWEWYVRAIVLGREKTSYTDIDVTVFDMMGVSESGGKNRALIQQERREYLESILPASVLRDYDKYAFPIEQYQRLKKYHLWGFVYFMERVLFKLEKWGIVGERLKVRG